MFVYGSLRDPGIRAAVIGRTLAETELVAARLRGYRLLRVKGCTYPMIVAFDGGVVDGLVLHGLTASEFRWLDRFEGREYRRASISVETGPGSEVTVHIYRPCPGVRHDKRPWRFETWSERERRVMLARIRIWRKSGRWPDAAITKA